MKSPLPLSAGNMPGMRPVNLSPLSPCALSAAGKTRDPLTDYPYIGRHTDSDLSARINRWLAAHDLAQICPHMWIDSIDACKEMVRYGLGWCILPRICLDDFDGYAEDLYMEDGTPFLRNTYVLYKHLYAELPQVKLFLEALLSNPNQM